MYELGMCYKCKYRGDVPGDAHSCCHYPGNDTNLFSMFESANFLQAAKLDIRAEKHGVMSGWFIIRIRNRYHHSKMTKLP